MMNACRRFLLLASLLLLLPLSVSAKKKYPPEKQFTVADLDGLNGRYVMSRMDLYEFFNIKAADYEAKLTYKRHGTAIAKGERFSSAQPIGNLLNDSTALDFAILQFDGKDSLTIIYRDADSWYRTTYRGKMKKDHFEIMLQKKRYPLLVVMRFDVDRIRIGLNEWGEVIVRNYSEHWGSFLVFGTETGGFERVLKLERLDE